MFLNYVYKRTCVAALYKAVHLKPPMCMVRILEVYIFPHSCACQSDYTVDVNNNSKKKGGIGGGEVGGMTSQFSKVHLSIIL